MGVEYNKVVEGDSRGVHKHENSSLKSASILLIHAVTGSCSNSPISIIPNNTGLKENIMHETIQPIAPTVITPEVALSGLTGKATSSIV
ncbi:hypothetical protein ACOSP7_024589 [Xanthoceras sorbifolium]